MDHKREEYGWLYKEVDDGSSHTYLVGREVFSRECTKIGKVKDVIAEPGATDFLVVKRSFLVNTKAVEKTEMSTDCDAAVGASHFTGGRPNARSRQTNKPQGHKRPACPKTPNRGCATCSLRRPRPGCLPSREAPGWW
jgi:hypothetical protein